MIREKHELKVEGDSKEKGGASNEKDLDMAMVVRVRGTKSSRLSRECRGRKDEAEVGSRMASRRYFHGLALLTWSCSSLPWSGAAYLVLLLFTFVSSVVLSIVL